jgi:pyruvate, orthophosphate dikinase
MTPTKRCYHFGPTGTDGRSSDRALLGGKGANLAEMLAIGLPVPPGFTLTTEACAAFQVAGELPDGLWREVGEHLDRLQQETGKRFGQGETPLLLSVRSGAAVSMPGMMDSILDLGLNEASVERLAAATTPRFAYDAYRRLINMYGDVVMGVDHAHFEQAFDLIKRRYDVVADHEVPAEGMKALCAAYAATYAEHVGAPFPQDPDVQLRGAIEAVFRSWNTTRAVAYRRIHDITGLAGTAVNVQAMVFGNMGPESATGVAFTRNPATGHDELYGEFLVNAQGEDVVAGIRTPKPLDRLADFDPDAYQRLSDIRRQLERHFGDMQDVEFTIEQGELFILQTRTGKRTGAAAVTIAVAMVEEGLIDRPTALMRVPTSGITQLLLPSFSPEARQAGDRIGTGLPASPGAASGRIVFTAAEAVERAHDGDDVVLVRRETSPEDIDGMHYAQAIVTATGGMTSHAAVVARGWGKCCVVGVSALSVDPDEGVAHLDGRRLRAGDIISVDGATGEIFAGEVTASMPSHAEGSFARIMGWADEHARLGVRANADTASDAQRARDLGATGIGLCRTEHMFFGVERIAAMRRMILADTLAVRRRALSELLPIQRADFEGLFEVMTGLPVTIRLLDPPLHEFVPHSLMAQRALAAEMGVPERLVARRVEALQEANPMLGHRGCRLAISYPEMAEMQVRAIVEAALACQARGLDPHPHIMVPLVGSCRELECVRAVIETTIEAVYEEGGARLPHAIPIGTMIEVPRAALTAERIAGCADFFSFGTNDLTQLTFGFSRDDVGSFLPTYLEQHVLPADPFAALDTRGVGRLLVMATEDGRRARPDLEVGVCGEHGGHAASVHFFHRAGLDYVSCSPYRVPVARLAAAQAAIAAEAATAALS